MPRTRVAIALILVTLLAGCTGTTGSASDAGKDDGAPTGTDGGPRDGDDASGNATAFTVRWGSAGGGETVWANGTFAGHEAGHPVNELPADVPRDNLRVVDVSHLVPKGMPVVITAEVRADLAEGDLDLFPMVPNDEVWSRSWDTPFGGYSRFSLVLVHTSSDPVSVAVYYDEPEPAPEFAYSLSVTVDPQETVLPDGLPVALPLPGAGAELLVEFGEDAEEPALLVYDPRDRLLGRYQPDGASLAVPLPVDAPAGEYVLMLAQGSGSARVSVTGVDAAPTPRYVNQVITFGAGHAASGRDPVTWTFDAPVAPLQVGFHISAAEAVQNPRASIHSPAGAVLDVAFEDPLPWMRVGGAVFLTRMGAPGLVAGTYEATWAPDATIQGEVAEVVVTYGR